MLNGDGDLLGDQAFALGLVHGLVVGGEKEVNVLWKLAQLAEPGLRAIGAGIDADAVVLLIGFLNLLHGLDKPGGAVDDEFAVLSNTHRAATAQSPEKENQYTDDEHRDDGEKPGVM